MDARGWRLEEEVRGRNWEREKKEFSLKCCQILKLAKSMSKSWRSSPIVTFCATDKLHETACACNKVLNTSITPSLKAVVHFKY
jgi:hypothetical protein